MTEFTDAMLNTDVADPMLNAEAAEPMLMNENSENADMRLARHMKDSTERIVMQDILLHKTNLRTTFLTGPESSVLEIGSTTAFEVSICNASEEGKTPRLLLLVISFLK